MKLRQQRKKRKKQHSEIAKIWHANLYIEWLNFAMKEGNTLFRAGEKLD